MSAKLTGMQKLFAQEYLVDLNAAEAARRAGYSARTAPQMANKLMANPRVQEAIQKAMRGREIRTEITQDRVLRELAKIGFADIKDFVSFRTEQTKVGALDNGDPVIDYAQVVEMRDSDNVDGTLVSEIHLKDGSLKFKLHDKMSALEKLGKHLGMFTDKVELTGKGGGPVQYQAVDLSRLSDQELEELEKIQAKITDTTTD